MGRPFSLARSQKERGSSTGWTGSVVPGPEGDWEGASRSHAAAVGSGGQWGAHRPSSPCIFASPVILSISSAQTSVLGAEEGSILCTALKLHTGSECSASGTNRACGEVRGQNFGSGESVWQSGEGFPEEVAFVLCLEK